MSYGLYDADLPYYPIPFYNLELMKISSYYKRKREIVGLAPSYSPNRYNHFIVRQDFYNPNTQLFTSANVTYGGRAFDGDEYKPLPLEIEQMKPDISLYGNVNPQLVQGYNKSALNTMRRAEHVRLSLDGKTIWNDFDKQLRHDSDVYGIIFHDYNLNDVEGAQALIRDNIADWIPRSDGRRIGMKYPVIVDNQTDLFSWLNFRPMGTYFSLTHKGIIDNSYIPELAEVFKSSTATNQTSVDVFDGYTNDALISSGLQRILRSIINLRTHRIVFPLIYNENILIDDDWKQVMKLIERYNRHLITVTYRTAAEYFQRVEPYETLYSYYWAAIRQYHTDDPFYTKESIQSIFQFVRENNYNLFKDFYEYRGGEIRK